MKKIAINIAICLVAVILPSIILDRFVNEGLKKSDLLEGCVNDIFNGKASADILISGNSRAVNHFSPKIMDSVLHKSVYNIGIRGFGAQMCYCLFKLYMQHNTKPTYIVMNIGLHVMSDREDFFGYEQFIPYAKDSIIQKYTCNLQGSFSFADKYYPLFGYNNHPELIKEGVKSYFHIGKPTPKLGYRGYVPLDQSWAGDLEILRTTNPDVFKFQYTDSILHLFTHFVKECRDDSIKVIFVYCPTYYEATELMTNRQEMLNIYSKIAKDYDVPILDYTFDSLSYNKGNFMNSQHLNVRASEIFSRKVAQDLKKYIH